MLLLLQVLNGEIMCPNLIDAAFKMIASPFQNIINQNRNTINSFLPPANKIPPAPPQIDDKLHKETPITSPAIQELKSYGVDTTGMSEVDAKRYLPVEKLAFQRKIDKMNGYKLVDNLHNQRQMMADAMMRQNTNGQTIVKFG